MPIPALKSLADKSGKSLSDLERYYNDAKKQLGKEPSDSDYAYIIGIVKKRAGIKEIEMKVKDFIESKLNAKDFIEKYYKEDETPPTVTPGAVDSNIKAEPENVNPAGNTSSDFRIPTVFHRPEAGDINVGSEIDKATGEADTQGHERDEVEQYESEELPSDLKGLF